MLMHTQGPWEAKHIDENHFVIVGADGAGVARSQIPFPPATVEANAKLIAAAPDLLEALREIASVVDEITSGAGKASDYQIAVLLSSTRAVIAAATCR